MGQEKSKNLRKLFHDLNNDLGIAVAGIQVAQLRSSDDNVKNSLSKSEAAFKKLKEKLSTLRQTLKDEGLILDDPIIFDKSSNE